MNKTIKMVVYGEPGVGKSTFAFGAPKPFFITTDGNYEYLVDYFGADENSYKQVFSWAQAKKVFEETDFTNYDTIVVDLLEDLYIWAEQEFCKENNLKHISDFGYGKGYGMLGDAFFIAISKLLALPKNIILIMHGTATNLKDRRGVDYTVYAPSSHLREKVRNQIEGRVRFFLRAFATTEESADGVLTTNRYLSLSPDGTTEFGITRGLVGECPRYIPLDWDVFYTIATRNPINFNNSKKMVAEQKEVVKEPVDDKEDADDIEPPTTKVIKAKPAKKSQEETIKDIQAKLKKAKQNETVIEDVSTATDEVAVEQPKVEQQVVETPVVVEQPKTDSYADKMAALKAKMAALKANKGE